MKKLIMMVFLMVTSVFGEEQVRKYITSSQVSTDNGSTVLNQKFIPYYDSAQIIRVEKLGKQILDFVDKGNFDYAYRYRVVGILHVDGKRIIINEIDGKWSELYDALQILTEIYDKEAVLENVTMLTEKYSSYNGKDETTRYNFCYDEVCFKPINYLLNDKKEN